MIVDPVQVPSTALLNSPTKALPFSQLVPNSRSSATVLGSMSAMAIFRQLCTSMYIIAWRELQEADVAVAMPMTQGQGGPTAWARLPLRYCAHTPATKRPHHST